MHSGLHDLDVDKGCYPILNELAKYTMFTDTVVWRASTGEVISCYEKNKVMKENLDEIRQICQDVFEDALLMGCDENQVKAELSKLIDSLANPYRNKK